jgi:hypothetical protein
MGRLVKVSLQHSGYHPLNTLQIVLQTMARSASLSIALRLVAEDTQLTASASSAEAVLFAMLQWTAGCCGEKRECGVYSIVLMRLTKLPTRQLARHISSGQLMHACHNRRIVQPRRVQLLVPSYPPVDRASFSAHF